MNCNVTVYANVSSHEQVITFDVMTETCELMSPMDESNFPLKFPPINIDEAYEFTSFLFTYENSRKKSLEIQDAHPTLELQKPPLDKKETTDIPRMRGKVADSLVEPRTKENFDKEGTTKLEIQMQIIHGS